MVLFSVPSGCLHWTLLLPTPTNTSPVANVLWLACAGTAIRDADRSAARTERLRLILIVLALPCSRGRCTGASQPGSPCDLASRNRAAGPTDHSILVALTVPVKPDKAASRAFDPQRPPIALRCARRGPPRSGLGGRLGQRQDVPLRIFEPGDLPH